MQEQENVSQATGNIFPMCQTLYTLSQPVLNEWTNHSSFYAIYPSYYYTFANQWLRKWLAWFDGYVPGIHDGRGGILSTRLATTLCYRLAEQVFGGGILFSKKVATDDSNEALKFISGEWIDNTDFVNQVLKTFVLAAAGGTSYLKLNYTSDKNLWVDSWRADQCFADMDFQGNVTHAKFIIANYTKTVPNKDKEKEQNFYLIEERFIASKEQVREFNKKNKEKIIALKIPPMHIGKCYTIYTVFRLQGTVNDFNQAVNLGSPLTFDELPNDIAKNIKDEFGTISLNKPQLLPFNGLGVYSFKWTSFISNLPQLPYGESLIAKIQTYLFEYDFMNSCMNTDFYLGRGRVLVPKSLQNPKLRNLNNVNVEAANYNSGLDSFIYTKYDALNNEQQKPESIQFELRTQEWLTARNNLLECMATAIGISPSTIASYLQDSSARTAREISSEESATALFIENRRKLFSKPLNDIIRDILTYKGFTDCVVVRFSKSGQTNTTLVVENVTSKYSAGLISLYLAIKDLNPDMNEDELQQEIERIKTEQKEKSQEQNLFGNGFNEDLGGFNDDERDRTSKETRFELASNTSDGNRNEDKNSN